MKREKVKLLEYHRLCEYYHPNEVFVLIFLGLFCLKKLFSFVSVTSENFGHNK